MSEFLLYSAQLLLNATSALIRMVPPRVRYLPADIVTGVLIHVWPLRMRHAIENFSILLNTDPSDARAQTFARRSIRNSGRMATDFLCLRTLMPAEVAKRTTVDGLEHIATALQANRGVILVLPHLGSWDVAAVLASAAGLAVTIVTENSWSARLAASSRRLPGVRLVQRDHSLRPLIRALARNEAVVLLSDFARSGVQTVRVPFMGRTAPMPSGPARLSIRYGAPILVVSAARTGPGTYRVEIQPPLGAQPTANHDQLVVELTASIATGFERAIRRYPAQWYPFSRIWPELPQSGGRSVRGSTLQEPVGAGSDHLRL